MLFIISLPLPALSKWEISFGEKENQAGFINPPKFEEDHSKGPHSFRLINSNLWIADSTKGRIFSLNSENKLVNSINLKNFGKDYFIDDFALQFGNGSDKAPTAICITERMTNSIIKLSVTGKELLKIMHSKQGTQVDEIACDSKGQIYLGDYSKSKIFVYSAQGKLVRTLNWQLSGFALDKNDNLYILEFKEKVGSICKVYNAAGKLIKTMELGFAKAQNPKIWHISNDGNILVSFILALGNPTAQILVSYDSTGKILKKHDFNNPYFINRYLVFDDNNSWVIKTNYMKAPKEIIKTIKIGEIK